MCTKERKGVTAEVLIATPCTNSLGGESGGHKHEGGGGRRLCWREKSGLLEVRRRLFRLRVVYDGLTDGSKMMMMFITIFAGD